MAEQAESFREAGDFQDFLAGGRIPQKTSRHEIHEGVMIVEVAEKFFHLPEAGLLGDFHGVEVLEDFGRQGVAHHRLRSGAGLRILDRLRGGDDVGPHLDEVIQTDAGEALQNQMGGAVGLGDTGPDEAETADAGGGLARLLHGDGKHAGTFQRLGEHVPVAGLEDPQREEMMGKEDRLGQNHHPDLLGKCHHLVSYSSLGPKDRGKGGFGG